MSDTTPNKIKKSQLAEIIQSVVRECINERKDKWIQKAIDPSHKGYCTPMTKSTCTPARKAFAQRAKHHDLQEGGMQEVAPPGFSADGKYAKVYNKLMNQYKGNEKAAYATMWKLHKKLDEAAYKVVSPNQTDTAAEDKARTIQTDPQVTEASYKVVSPNQTDTAKEDKARTIQTEPKVNETAFKKQGPSCKTFEDSPQFPDAVNNPENA